MGFHLAYELFIEHHRGRGSPERRRKLRNGVGFAERTFLQHVWWPLMGNFEHLHPEYEVADYSGSARFVDFAYVRGTGRLAIEIDGFAAHAKQLDRRQFAYRLHRQNVLTVDGWDILRFAFDEVKTNPRRCQQTIQQYMGSRFATNLTGRGDRSVTAIDREIVRLARSRPRPFSPTDVAQHLGLGRAAVYRHLRRLVERGWLVPASGEKRIRTYRLAQSMRRAGF